MNLICNILGSLFFLSGIVGTIAIHQFLSRLRKNHAKTWEQLGEPVLFLNFGVANVRKFIGFMWRKDYEALPDERTKTFAWALRAYLICCAFLGGLTVVAFSSVGWIE